MKALKIATLFTIGAALFIAAVFAFQKAVYWLFGPSLWALGGELLMLIFVAAFFCARADIRNQQKAKKP